MKKLWRVMGYEYRRHVLRKGFILSVLGVPLWILLMGGVMMLLIAIETDTTPVGYVDYSGQLDDSLRLPPPTFPNRSIPLAEFETEELAQAALDRDEIQTYYVVPASYPDDTQIKQFYRKPPAGTAESEFRRFLRLNLLIGYPEQVVSRALEGSELVVQAADESEELQGFGMALKFIVPFFSGFVLMIAVFTSSGYLMQAVVDEKQNRTMEIMVTSVSPGQMMTGKVIALIGVGLTQIGCWLIFGVVGLLVGRVSFDFLSGFQINFGNLWLTVLMIIPAFVMISAMMAAVGASVTEASEGQQVTGLITLPVMVPLFFMFIFVSNPNSPLAVGLSLFPLTAPLTMIIRSAFTTIPAWQVVASTLILVLSTVASLWLAGRIFRIGMLRYGQRVRLKELFPGRSRTGSSQSANV